MPVGFLGKVIKSKIFHRGGDVDGTSTTDNADAGFVGLFAAIKQQRQGVSSSNTAVGRAVSASARATDPLYDLEASEERDDDGSDCSSACLLGRARVGLPEFISARLCLLTVAFLPGSWLAKVRPSHRRRPSEVCTGVDEATEEVGTGCPGQQRQ